eukprot:c14663_g1_i1 orf=1016-1318(+)
MASSLYRLRGLKQSNSRHKRENTTDISMDQQRPTSTLTNGPGPIPGPSNLNCFLDHITPSLQIQYPLKSSYADNASDRCKDHSDSMPPFNLGDLWRSFDE